MLHRMKPLKYGCTGGLHSHIPLLRHYVRLVREWVAATGLEPERRINALVDYHCDGRRQRHCPRHHVEYADHLLFYRQAEISTCLVASASTRSTLSLSHALALDAAVGTFAVASALSVVAVPRTYQLPA